MIQRIQTAYLLFTTITAILFLSGEIFVFENGMDFSLSGLSSEINTIDLVFSALLMAVPLLSFLIIFIYKKRKLQLRLTLLLLLLIIAMVGVAGYYIYIITSRSDTGIIFTYKLILPFLMLIFTFLAYRGIRKDEEIVRSYDRLR